MTTGQGGAWPSGEAQVSGEATRVVRHATWCARRADEIAQQREEAAAFVPPVEYEEAAPRALC